jgi:hypothetical protein
MLTHISENYVLFGHMTETILSALRFWRNSALERWKGRTNVLCE